MSLTLRDIAHILQQPSEFADIPIDEIAIDSRVIIRPEKSLFIALSGPSRHGHQFIPDAYALGVRHFIVEETQRLPEDAIQLQVTDSLHALQHLASAYRTKWSGKVLGITGSNGKTIIKEWVHHLLQGQLRVDRSPGSYNSQIGVPLSVLGMDSDRDAYIIEAGISQKNEMSPLQRIIDPDLGVMTILGDAHNAGFNTLAEKLDEKLRLFQGCKTILYPADDQTVDTRVKQLFSKSQLRGVSLTHNEADYCLMMKGQHASFYKNGVCIFDQINLPFNSQVFRHNLAHSRSI